MVERGGWAAAWSCVRLGECPMNWDQLPHLNFCVAGTSPQSWRESDHPHPCALWRELCLHKVSFAAMAIFLQAGWLPARFPSALGISWCPRRAECGPFCPRKAAVGWRCLSGSSRLALAAFARYLHPGTMRVAQRARHGLHAPKTSQRKARAATTPRRGVD